jgi:phage terminase small subunit
MNAITGTLTAKQERFCQEYTIDLNATAAARRAGYSEKTAEQQGSRLFRNVQVKARIAELQDEVAERNKLSVDGVVTNLAELRDKAVAAGQMGPAIRAQELIGRTIGAFVDRQLTGEETLDHEQLIEQIAQGDPERRAMAQKLFPKVPRNFEEGANAATRKRFRSTGVG